MTKLTVIMLTAVCMQVAAAGFAQKVSVTVTNAPVRDVLYQLTRQTGYNFIADAALLSALKPITLDVKNRELKAVLERCFDSRQFEIVFNENETVVIRERRHRVTQQYTIRGRVADVNGNALAGVTVKVRSTGWSTITDNDGEFTIRSADKQLVLLFSMIGYISGERSAEAGRPLQVILEEGVDDLNEVIVVGYGTQKRSDITGAISSVKVSDLDGVPLRSMDQALQGRVSGVFMSQNGSQPGGGTTIRIRGGNSITGSNEPLYVIDGVPVYVSPTESTSLNPLNSISPGDIESIEVLKDASATAIYGSRGGNGVVLITTRRGRSGEAQITADFHAGFQDELRRYDLLSAKEFETLANEASLAEGGPLLYDPTLNPVTTDWQGMLFRKGAPLQNYQLSASGGTAANRFLLTLNYFDQQGIIRSSDMNRYSMRFNFDREINKRITIGNSLTFSRVDVRRINAASMFSMLSTPPDLPVWQPDGTYTQFNQQGSGFNNPVALLNDYKNLNKVLRGLGNVFANIRLAEGLTFKTMWGIDASFMKQDSYMPQTVFSGSQVGGEASVSTNQNTVWLNENTLTFARTYDAHRFDILAGYTQQSARFESLGATATGFLNDNTGSNNLGLGNPDQATLPNSGTAGWTILSWIGRANYGFRDRYLVTLTGRYDGSSRFGKNNRWGFFPSIAVAWRAIEENFLKDVGFLSDFKVRLSHGITGNQDGIGNYPALDLWTGANYVLNNQIAQGITPNQIANQNLRWESTAQSDIGLELGFFNNRLSLSTDVYYKRTSDLLLEVTVPATSGFTEGVKNIGSLENKGLELTLNATPVQRAFSWNTSFNISFNRNKVLDLGVEDEIIPAGVSTTLLKVGEPIGNFLGYISRGLFQTIEDVAEGAQPAARPGDIWFIDFNNDGVLNALDRRVMGNAQPDFYGGFNNSFGYKGFDFSFFFQFVYGNELYNMNRITLENLRGLQNQDRSVLQRWTPENRNTVIPRASSTRATDDAHDRYVEDGSYLRLKNVQVSYAVPVRWFGGGNGVRSLKVYANVQNLLTFSSYSGMDPEVNRYANNNVRQGYDSGSYPTVRTVTFGINANF